MQSDILAGPPIWRTTLLEQAWHQSISDIWTHTVDCVPCSLAEASERPTRCSEGLALREAETAAYREYKADQYVPLALAEVAS